MPKISLSEIYQDIIITEVNSIPESRNLHNQNPGYTNGYMESGDHIHGVYQISWPKTFQKYIEKDVNQILQDNICVYFAVVENGKFHQGYHTYKECATIHPGSKFKDTNQRISWTFPFDITLPTIYDFPSSFNSSHASIRHGLFAQVHHLEEFLQLSKKDFIPIFEKNITVSFTKASLLFSEYSRPYSCRDQQPVPISRGGGTIFTMIKINKRSFHPGEQIYLTIQLKNESKIQISTTYIRLLRVIKHYQNHGKKKHAKPCSKTKLISSEKLETRTFDKSTVLHSNGIYSKVSANSSLDEWNLSFTLPANLHATSIGTSVHLEYYLKISLCTKVLKCENTIIPICILYPTDPFNNPEMSNDLLFDKFAHMNMISEVQMNDTDELFNEETIKRTMSCISDDDPRSIFSDCSRDSDSSYCTHELHQSKNREIKTEHSTPQHYSNCRSGRTSPCNYGHSRKSSQEASLYSIEG